MLTISAADEALLAGIVDLAVRLGLRHGGPLRRAPNDEDEAVLAVYATLAATGPLWAGIFAPYGAKVAFRGAFIHATPQVKFNFVGSAFDQCELGELLRFVNRIESGWRPPRSCLGGSDLVLIRQMRNDLAHGVETFETVGSQFSTQDIADKFKRVRTFMVSLIKGLEHYKTRRHYHRAI